MSLLPLLLMSIPMQEPPILRQTFQEDSTAWSVLQPAGSGAKLTILKVGEHVRPGSGSLKIDYSIAEGQVAAAVMPLEIGAWNGFGSMSFWLQSDYNAPFVVTLEENDGGRYSAAFFAPKNKWQQVELNANDFTLSTDAGAPKDPDGKLDFDKLKTVAIMNFDEFLVQNPMFVKLLAMDPGAHSFYVSDVTVSKRRVADSTTAKAGEFTIDNYVRPQCGWVGIGGPVFTTTGNTMQIQYRVEKGHILGGFRQIPIGSLKGLKTMNVPMASIKATKVVVQLEEEGGGKYNTVIDLPAGGPLKDHSFLLSGLVPADDSHDANNTLDPEQVKQLVLIELTGIIDQADLDNTLTLGPITAKS